MKKLISAILTASMLCVSALPIAFAADTVTEKDVKAAMEKNALLNSKEDYELYQNGTMPGTYMESFKKTFSEKDAYQLYRFKDYQIVDDEMRVCFYGKDAKTAKISDELDNENWLGGRDYVYKDISDNTRMGNMYLCVEKGEDIGFSSYGINMDENALFFRTDELTRIINEAQIGMPEDIRYVDNANYSNTGSFLDSTFIYIQTDTGEYMVTDVKYSDGHLSNYLVLDSEEFIGYMQNDYTKMREKAYNNLQVQKAPEFSDIDDKDISLLARLSIISGYEDGTFGGERNVTRAEAARMIALATCDKDCNMEYNEDEFSYDLFVFEDVDDSHWARNYITYGYASRYISGGEQVGEKYVGEVTEGYTQDENGVIIPNIVKRYIPTYNFRPEDTVTEQELAKMLVSAIDDFGDTMASAEGGWPDGYAAVAKRMGICQSTSDKPATRLTAAHMIKNAIDAQVTKNVANQFKQMTDDEGNITSSEEIFEKGTFYNMDWTARRVKLTGKITATSDTDSTLREKEVKFVVGADVSCHMGDYKKGEELTLIMQYDDVKNYVNKDCSVYCEFYGGNLTVVMAQ